MVKKIISMSVESDIYSKYVKLCKEQGIVMSKQVENFMRQIIDNFEK